MEVLQSDLQGLASYCLALQESRRIGGGGAGWALPAKRAAISHLNPASFIFYLKIFIFTKIQNTQKAVILRQLPFAEIKVI